MEAPVKRLSEIILAKGLDQADISMLSEGLRQDVLNEAASALMAAKRFDEAARALAMAGATARLVSLSDEFMRQKNFRLAAVFLARSGDENKIRDIAMTCVREGMFKEAVMCFEAIKDEKMADFVRKNY
ncbi:MAG: hypothetical protein ABIH41_00155 [Nanoarchaeota archaeon]